MLSTLELIFTKVTLMIWNQLIKINWVYVKAINIIYNLYLVFPFLQNLE